MSPRRIVVLGTSGSGKTTLAAALARRLGLRHIELDSINWLPGWVERPRVEMVRIVAEQIREGDWALCGNYGSVRDLTCNAADTIVWLDYPMSVVVGRLTRRIFRRWWNQEVICNGNRERLWEHFFSKNSLYLWVLQTWRKRRRDYPAFLATLQKRGKRVHRLRSPRQTEQWLASLPSYPS